MLKLEEANRAIAAAAESRIALPESSHYSIGKVIAAAGLGIPSE